MMIDDDDSKIGADKAGFASEQEFKRFFLQEYSTVDEGTFAEIIEAIWGLQPNRAADLMAHADVAPPHRRKKATVVVSAGLQPLVIRLRSELRRRGVAGHLTWSRRLRSHSVHGLGLAPFKLLIKQELGRALESSHDVDRDLRLLFSELTSSHTLDIHILTAVLSENSPMNARRKQLVRSAFRKIDANSQGGVPAASIFDCFTAREHPCVLAGSRTNEAVTEEFHEMLATEGITLGGEDLCNFDQFVDAHEHLSSVLADDNEFEKVVRGVWQVALAPSPSGEDDTNAGKATVKVIVTRADGRATLEEIDESIYAQVKDDHHLKIIIAQQHGIRAQDIVVLDPVSKRNNPGDAAVSLTRTARQSCPQNPAKIPHAAGKSAVDSSKNNRVYETNDGQALITKRRTPVPERRDAAPKGPLVNIRPPQEFEVDGIGRPRKAVVGRGDRLLAGLPRHLQSSLHVWPSSVANSAADAESFPRRVPHQPLSQHSIVLAHPAHSDGDATALPPPPPPQDAVPSTMPETQLLPTAPRQNVLIQESSGTDQVEKAYMSAHLLAVLDEVFRALSERVGGVTIAPEALVREYDASRHPDVRKGHRTHNEVRAFVVVVVVVVVSRYSPFVSTPEI